MTVTTKSRVLLALAALLGALVLVPSASDTPADALPRTPVVLPDDVTRITLGTALDTLVLARVGTDPKAPEYQSWAITSPLQADADAAQVRTLLKGLAGGVEMLAHVGEGDPKDYGLSNEYAIHVQLYTKGEAPAVSLVVGKPAGGPTAFVRLPDSPVIWRADVGGRARYERPAADWRDKMALDVPRERVRALTLVRGKDDSVRVVRAPSTEVDTDGNPVVGPWVVAPNTHIGRDGSPSPDARKGAADEPVDSATIDLLVGALARLRAGEIHNPDYAAGFDAPAATATLTLDDGSAHRVVLGGKLDDGAAFVRVDDRPDIYRVSGQVARLALQPREQLRDRSILAFTAGEVDSLTLAEGGMTIVMAQSSDGAGTWTVTQPANLDADQKLARALLLGLAGFRADALPTSPTFVAGNTTLTVRFRDGGRTVLTFGIPERDAENRPLVRVRVEGAGEKENRVFLVKLATLNEIRRTFGRG